MGLGRNDCASHQSQAGQMVANRLRNLKRLTLWPDEKTPPVIGCMTRISRYAAADEEPLHIAECGAQRDS